MKNIENFLDKEAKKKIPCKPVILDLRKNKDLEKIKKIIKSGGIDQVVDDYKEQLHELFAVNNPGLVYGHNFKDSFKKYFKILESEMPMWKQGRWVYFPWLSKIVHLLPEEDFYTVRTARNRNLIRKDEQDNFYNATVGIGGLSIGNSIALAIVLKGGAKHIKIADMDRLALSNINRIRSGINNLGLLKTEMTARQIYEINPYAEVEIFSNGLSKDNMEDFFVGKKKLDVVVDELDNMAVKYLIREYAKKHRVPVVMAADNGDSAVIDVERYDLDPKIEFFHGRMGKVTYSELSKLDKFGIGKMITKHIGYENIPERMQESLMEMGKTIVSWPQLGNTALINGSIIAYLIRRIVNSQEVINDRAIISLDEKLVPGYYLEEESSRRKRSADYFKNIFGL
jgi:molybdopterin/thiamine biosynthesis adenylyltransferase